MADLIIKKLNQPDVIIGQECQHNVVLTPSDKYVILAAIDAAKVALQGDDVTATLTYLKEAIANISIDTSDLAKEATLGASPDQSVSTTIFGWLQAIRDFLVRIVTTEPYAKESSVKDGNDTAIGVLKDQNIGLAAIKDAVDNIEGVTPISNEQINSLFEESD